MKFRVHFTKTVTAEVVVDADSYEDAVAAAIATNPNPTHVLSEPMIPDWVGTEAHLLKHDEYEHEILGSCSICHRPLVQRTIPDQPWIYGQSEAPPHDIACFACLKGERQP